MRIPSPALFYSGRCAKGTKFRSLRLREGAPLSDKGLVLRTTAAGPRLFVRRPLIKVFVVNIMGNVIFNSADELDLSMV